MLRISFPYFLSYIYFYTENSPQAVSILQNLNLHFFLFFYSLNLYLLFFYIFNLFTNFFFYTLNLQSNINDEKTKKQRILSIQRITYTNSQVIFIFFFSFKDIETERKEKFKGVDTVEINCTSRKDSAQIFFLHFFFFFLFHFYIMSENV